MNRMMNVLTVLCACCALTVTGLLVRRELRASAPAGLPTRGPAVATLADEPVAEWARIAEGGRRLGSPAARVVLVEFADLECPACAAFSKETADWLPAAYGDSVAVVFRHFPLAYHRFAYPAARAAECAGEQGRFHEFVAAVYGAIDSLGLKPFDATARQVGVTDSIAFRTCNARSDKVERVEQDRRLAETFGPRGTPAILLDGRLYDGVPDSARLATAIRGAIDRAYAAGK